MAITPADKAEKIADCWKLQFEPNQNFSNEFTNNLITSETDKYFNSPHVNYIHNVTATEVGFDVVLCESVVQNLYFETDLHCEVFLETTFPCGIPVGMTDYFKNISIDTFRKYSGRNNQNKISFKMTVLKMMLRKPS
ncbi:hypothetical protein CEXT_243381 [Caerostris extrusa]|uniref:Uncharacterized protein n=1 Tax=Caerostris extrusa TaxID=172846 RepID=A0AAV4TQ15_CAEEX|nr:hypothetical protein CEXT_243381 [Caerostris extrusa]